MPPRPLKTHRLDHALKARKQWARHRSVLRFQFRHVEGGVDAVVTVLQASEHEGIKRFVEAYIDLTSYYRRIQDLDALALDCKVSPSEIIGEYAKLGFDQGWDVARGIAGLEAPAMMSASMRLARKAT